MDDNPETTGAPAISTSGDQPPAAVTEPTVEANNGTSVPVQDSAAVDHSFTTPFLNQGNGFIPQVQDFAAINPTINGNGTLPMGVMIPTNPPLPEFHASHAPQPVNGHAMSAEEIALYDRQIRLWGMQAQQKIQAANILLISMKALGNEIAKNLVLAGIASLTIVDDQIVTEADLGAQFFLSQENIGQNRAEAAAVQVQKLNPRVKVFPDSGSIMTKGASYFAAFDVVIAVDLDPTLLAFINTATRLHNRQFYAAGVHGVYGYIFCDLIEHDYVLKRDKANVATTVGPESRFRSVIDVQTQKEGGKVIEMVTKRDFYSTWDLVSETSLLPAEYTKSKRRLKAVSPALSCLRALWGFHTAHHRAPNHNKQDLEWFTRSATHSHQLLSLPPETLRSEFLRSFLQNINSEIVPVTAILGGQLAQDVINVLGQNQQPIQNMVIFDGNKMEANMYPLHPEGNLGRSQLDYGYSLPMGMGQIPVDMTQGPQDMFQMMPVEMANTTIPQDTTPQNMIPQGTTENDPSVPAESES
ncbi:hypothetical protein F5B22DRAFT_10375 [Xylaria bambusicola]|uniref:uncharacterized protein n=1 Tax=Xylaria bambusicola TaxID=326684 RepID=UPI002008351E|nr:uncharacterized protein F5B22DRAFT_10375 [Xylaria bambusicola]KAI0527912.1 hypothetical protein F5B22DRAFT_10375 [Xylaria bambusicola]